MLTEEQDVGKAVLDAIIVKSQVTGTLERVMKPAAKQLPKSAAKVKKSAQQRVKP